MMSESFGVSEHGSKRHRTQRELFLEKMDKPAPWVLLVDLANLSVRTAAGAAPVSAGDNSPGAVPAAVLQPGRPPGPGHPVRHAGRPAFRRPFVRPADAGRDDDVQFPQID